MFDTITESHLSEKHKEQVISALDKVLKSSVAEVEEIPINPATPDPETSKNEHPSSPRTQILEQLGQ
jgi:hypothetical protein